MFVSSPLGGGYLLFAGCDWSDRWLDVAVVDRSGAVLGETRIVYAETPDPVVCYREFLAPLGRRWRATVTGIEDVNILFARALAASGLEVVHVDPTRAARHRAALGTPKTDRADARLIASMTLAGECRPLVATSPTAEALRVVAHAHRAAVAHRVEALHSLWAALMRFWPAAVSAWPASVGGLRNPQARAILAAAPGPRAAARLDRRSLAALLTWTRGRSRTLARCSPLLAAPSPRRRGPSESARRRSTATCWADSGSDERPLPVRSERGDVHRPAVKAPALGRSGRGGRPVVRPRTSPGP